MIHDALVNARLYLSLGPRIAAGLEYLARFDPATPDGRHPIVDDEVFAIVETYDTGPGAEKRFESHRRHVDIQYVAEGRERILRSRAANLSVAEPYRDDTDVVLYRDPGFSSSILLESGDFAILHPDDAHKPGCMAGGRDRVKKVVVKVRI